MIISLIQHYCENDNYKIHLIPHVIENEKDCIDGDVYICRELARQYSVAVAPAFESPIEAKNYISAMDVFVGARMHSTIAAYSSGVPVIPFSYSRKFEGLYENLGYRYLIHGREDDTQAAIAKTFCWIDNRVELKKEINASMKIIDSYLNIFSDDISKKISIYRR